MPALTALISAANVGKAFFNRGDRSSLPGNLSLRQVAKGSLVLFILLYGAALRLTAITETYGPVAQPGWLAAVQQNTAETLWRPDGLHWDMGELFPHRDDPPTRYRSDPYTYLQYGREMSSFYAAHRREPLFPFATRASLWMLSDQDVAVSFASATFSVLAIAATFLLGAAAFGYWVGAGAAALMAIENDLITWGVGGWRDDAFMFGVVLTCVALLTFRGHPGWRSGLALGVVAAAACLIRITSLSFIVPGLAVVALMPGASRRARLAGGGIAVATAALIVGPYLFNCWRVFGDPLYSINVHASVYQETEGRAGDPTLTARQYLVSQVRNRPARTIDTVVLGFTAYPFTNKWMGFRPWLRSAGYWMSIAALVGLLLFTASADGRLLLVVLVSSLIPYAATWRLIADWRFTEHTYPFFLVAACLALAAFLRFPLQLRRLDSADLRNLRPAIWWVAGSTACAAITWIVMVRVLPVAVVEEMLIVGEPAIITALDRDTAFFTGDWRPGPSDGVPTRVATGWRAEIRIPLPVAAAYDLLLRVDPSSVPITEGDEVQRIQVLLNGRLLGRCDTGSTPERIGTCRIRVPADVVRTGTNRLLLATDPQGGRGFRVWYVRVQIASGERRAVSIRQRPIGS